MNFIRNILEPEGYALVEDDLGFYSVTLNGASVGKGWELGPESYQFNCFEDTDEAWQFALLHSRHQFKAALPVLREALEDCNDAFASWQIGQIPGRPEDILALISKVRAALATNGERTMTKTPELDSKISELTRRIDALSAERSGLQSERTRIRSGVQIGDLLEITGYSYKGKTGRVCAIDTNSFDAVVLKADGSDSKNHVTYSEWNFEGIKKIASTEHSIHLQ